MVSPQGACANAVKRSAGPGMPDMAPPAGEIRVSTGSKMPCQHVIHTRCSEWEGGLGEGVRIYQKPVFISQLFHHSPSCKRRAT